MRQQPSVTNVVARPVLTMMVRLRELERLFASRYGAILPDDDAGREDLTRAAL